MFTTRCFCKFPCVVTRDTCSHNMSNYYFYCSLFFFFFPPLYKLYESRRCGSLLKLSKCPACQVLWNICHIIKCQQSLSTIMLPGSGALNIPGCCCCRKEFTERWRPKLRGKVFVPCARKNQYVGWFVPLFSCAPNQRFYVGHDELFCWSGGISSTQLLQVSE